MKLLEDVSEDAEEIVVSLRKWGFASRSSVKKENTFCLGELKQVEGVRNSTQNRLRELQEHAEDTAKKIESASSLESQLQGELSRHQAAGAKLSDELGEYKELRERTEYNVTAQEARNAARKQLLEKTWQKAAAKLDRMASIFALTWERKGNEFMINFGQIDPKAPARPFKIELQFIEESDSFKVTRSIPPIACTDKLEAKLVGDESLTVFFVSAREEFCKLVVP